MNKDTPSLGTSIEAAQINSRITGLDSKLTSVAANSLKSKSETKSPASSSQSSSALDRGGQASSPQYNCIFNICYNGEPRQFALAGQLLREDEEFDPVPPLI
jgi:hypothetical protein